MESYFFKQALLPNGWQKNVRTEIDENGCFHSVTIDSIQHANDEVHECIVSSMPNCHSHVFQRAMAGLTEYKTSDNDSFWSWRDLMYNYATKISAQQLYHIACYAYSEMLVSGYTSVCEFHYIHRDLVDCSDTESMSLAIINAAYDVGIQLTLLPVLYTQAHIKGHSLSAQQKRFKLSAEEYIALYQSLEKQLRPNQNMGICFHSLRAVSLSQMQQVLGALNHNQPIHIHIAEQTIEVEQLMQHSGMRPVEFLFNHFDVNENWCLIHATHINSREIQLIANSGAIAGICPLTEANLGDGVFPLKNYLQSNGRIAIGSDSHILINPFQEIQMLEYSQRLHHQKRIIASRENSPHVGTLLWNESVSGGAQSCHINVSGIKKGEQANWINIDTQHPLLTSLKSEEILDTLIFANNHMLINAYTHGRKVTEIDKIIAINYKNTLKSLR